MPPVNQQGSRAGLITSVVIFVILFVVSTIFAIYFGTQWGKEQALHEQDVKKYTAFVSPTQLVNPELTQISKMPETVIDALERQRDTLSKDLTGQITPTDKADEQTQAVLAYAAGKMTDLKSGVTLPPSGDLITATRTLTDAVTRTESEVAKAQKQAQAALQQAADANKNREDIVKERDANLAKLQAQIEDLRTKSTEYQSGKDKDLATLQADAQKQIKAFQDAATQLQASLSKRDATIRELTDVASKLRARLARTHIDPNKPMIQQADGIISSVPGTDTVFINIGQQQGVTTGLTFEVYDRNSGIPVQTAGQGEDELPIGKASIEVTNVLPQSSEARVIRLTSGKQLVQGDIVMNLVFDPHTKLTFAVYGDFDLGQTGNATPGDAEVIKRLVTQWGGKLQDVSKMNTDTDFLVLGKEPVVPILTEEDKNSAVAVKRHDDAVAALDAYQDIRQKAVQFGIPILNQDRFLYYTGYYEMAKR